MYFVLNIFHLLIFKRWFDRMQNYFPYFHNQTKTTRKYNMNIYVCTKNILYLCCTYIICICFYMMYCMFFIYKKKNIFCLRWKVFCLRFGRFSGFLEIQTTSLFFVVQRKSVNFMRFKIFNLLNWMFLLEIFR